MHIKLLNWIIEHSVFYPGMKDNLSIRLILFKVSNKHTHQSECYLLAKIPVVKISFQNHEESPSLKQICFVYLPQNLRNTMPQLFFYFYYF